MKVNLNEMTFKKKIQYYWDYYRTSTIVCIVLFLLVVFIIKTMISNKVSYDTYCLILNDTQNEKLVEHIKNDYPIYQNDTKHLISVDNGFSFHFLEEYGINWPEESAIVKLFALEEDKADIAIADYYTMLWAVNEDYIYPLNEILPKELLEQLVPYYEYAYFKGQDECDGKIYGLNISETDVFKANSNKYKNAVVFIPNLSTSSNKENRHSKSIEFIKYLYGIE